MQISAEPADPALTARPRLRGARPALPLVPLAARRSRKDEVYERLRQAILLRELNAHMDGEVARLPGLGGGRRARAVERIVALNRELHHHIDVASGNQRLLRLLDDTLDLSATQPVLLACSDDELARGIAQHA